MQVSAQPNNVVHLTDAMRREHYWKRLVYLGPTMPARCTCGATRSKWSVRKVREWDGFMIGNYRCKCGRPVLKVDEL